MDRRGAWREVGAVRCERGSARGLRGAGTADAEANSVEVELAGPGLGAVAGEVEDRRIGPVDGRSERVTGVDVDRGGERRAGAVAGSAALREEERDRLGVRVRRAREHDA